MRREMIDFVVVDVGFLSACSLCELQCPLSELLKESIEFQINGCNEAKTDRFLCVPDPDMLH